MRADRKKGLNLTADSIQTWLLTDGARLKTPVKMFEGYCEHLVEAGVDVERATLGVPLLHPLAQSAYAFWRRGEGADGRWFLWTEDSIQPLLDSPIYPIYQEGRGDRIRVTDPADRARYPIGEDLAEEGFTDYVALPLAFTDGSHKAVTYATKKPSGFSDGDLALIDGTIPALALVAEGFLAKRTAMTLLETYIGGRAGARVLDGQIKRGDGSHIQAVIWMSDLRNFTGLAQNHDTSALMKRLNLYLGTVVEAVAEEEGEVLKFIGDAVLAVFPYEEDTVGDAVSRAEKAAHAALSAVSGDDWPNDLKFGIALHTGNVFYGNIGGDVRLDFTVIGQAVNVASRMEGLCAQLEASLLVSDNIVKSSERSYEDCGPFTLKGVAEPVHVFRPAVA